MKLFNTPHKRKSIIISSLIMMMIIFVLFRIGLTYFDPPIENGIAIQWGDDKAIEQSSKIPKKQHSETKPSTLKTENTSAEKVISQQHEQTVVINKGETNSPTVKKEVVKPKINKETTDILNQILNSAESSNGKNEEKNTQKGSATANPYANAFYGNSKTGKSWGLNGRNLVSGGKVIPQCNEFGIVVVRIEVDRNGNVVKATPGVKGTTNNHPCLMQPALKTALMHKWNADEKAPERQIGFIEIHFKLAS